MSLASRTECLGRQVKEKERFLEVLIQETPMKRIGKPEEIASRAPASRRFRVGEAISVLRPCVIHQRTRSIFHDRTDPVYRRRLHCARNQNVRHAELLFETSSVLFGSFEARLSIERAHLQRSVGSVLSFGRIGKHACRFEAQGFRSFMNTRQTLLR